MYRHNLAVELPADLVWRGRRGTERPPLAGSASPVARSMSSPYSRRGCYPPLPRVLLPAVDYQISYDGIK